MCLTAAALLAVFLDYAILGALCMSLYYSGLLFYTLTVLPFFGYKAVYPNKYSTSFKVIKEQGKHNVSIKETSGTA